MTVDSPVSMTVTMSKRNPDGDITFATEFVVVDPDEARDKGEQFSALLSAFVDGMALWKP